MEAETLEAEIDRNLKEIRKLVEAEEAQARLEARQELADAKSK
jgi:hypothetical protein